MTRKEEVGLQRAAFVDGCSRYPNGQPILSQSILPDCTASAKELYPMPKTTRPRVITSQGTEFRIVDSVLQYRYPGDHDFAIYGVKDLLSVIERLATNPTEEVDCDC